MLQPRNQKNDGFSADKRKRQKKKNEWRLNRPRGQERSLVKREMALAEVRRREAAKKLSPFRPQVLRRMFTARRRTARRRSKVSWAQCSSPRARPSRNASRKLMRNTSTSPRTARFTASLSIFGTRVRQSI